jgi:hypothetical protein
MDLKGTVCENMDWFQLKMISMVCCCEHGGEHLGTVKDGEFLDHLSCYQFLSGPNLFCGISYWTTLLGQLSCFSSEPLTVLSSLFPTDMSVSLL